MKRSCSCGGKVERTVPTRSRSNPVLLGAEEEADQVLRHAGLLDLIWAADRAA